MTKRRIVRSAVSVFLSLALVLSGIMPGTPLIKTVQAAETINIMPGTDENRTGTGQMSISLKIKKTPTASDFTFTAPTTLMYDGTAKEATVTANNSAVGMGAITLKYYSGDTELSAAPTAEGTYTVKVNVAEGTEYKAAEDITADTWTFTIAPQTQTMTITLSIHGHTFAYSANGATITATCNGSIGTCDLTSNPTLTLVAPTKKVDTDNGSAEATLDAEELAAFNKATGLSITSDSIEYYEGTTKLETAPTTKGEYKAKLTVGTGENIATAEVGYSIGTSTQTHSMTITLVIKEKAKITTAPKANTLTYTGNAQALVTAGVANHGTMQYKLGEDGTYSDKIPTATDVGTYTVFYKAVKANDDYLDSDESSLEVSIGKANNTVSVSIDGWTYGGTASVPTATADFGAATATFTYSDTADGTYTSTVPTKVGTHYVKAAVAGTDNYNAAVSEPTAFVIKKAALTVTADAKNITYGDEDVALTYTVEGLTGSDKEEDVLTGTLTREAGTDAGTYKITQGSLISADYGITFTGADYVIAKAPQTAPAEIFTTSKATGANVADGKISGFAAAKAYQISSDDGKTWTDVTAESTSLDVKSGTYQIRYAGDKNHDAGASVNVTVEAKAEQSKPEGLSAVNVSAEDAKDGQVKGVNSAMEYSTDGGSTWTPVADGADKIDGLAKGDVQVRYAGTDDKNPSSAETVVIGVASKTEGVVEFKPEAGGTEAEEKAVTGVEPESTKASVDEFAETQQEEGKDVKVALEITPQKEDDVVKESVEETNKVVEEVFAGIDSTKVVTEYLAIDVAKYVDNVKEDETISDTKSPLEIALKFDNKKNNPLVVRTHDGKAKAFGKLKARPEKKDYRDGMFYVDLTNSILYIYSQFFSDFAIVYATETTYNVGFVSGTDVSVSPLVVTEGGKVTLPTGLTKTGFAFDGWYKDEAFSAAWKDSDTISSDITLYAKWNKSVSGVSVSPSEVKLTKAGETSQLKATVTPTDAANTKVSYKSSNTKVATVDANGKITAVANGTATITITTEDGAKTATVKVTVAIPEVKPQGTSEQPVAEPTKEEKAEISMNAGLKITQTGKKISIEWGKVKEADGYDVYVAYCGKKYGSPIKNVSKNTITKLTVGKIKGKKIDLKKNFKVYVAAYKMVDGQKEVLAKSITGHVVGRLNTKFTNAKKITISKKKYTVKVGKTAKVKAKTVLVDKKKKQLSDGHAKEFRYATSNKNIATVDKNGKVKGVAAGTCKIYVYSRNGLAKTVKITVK